MKPIFSIWLKPKKTFEYLINLDYVKLCNKLDFTLILISISIVLQSVLNNFERNAELGIFILILIGLLSIFFCFLFLKYVYAYMLLLFSRLFQGKAEILHIRIVLTYSLVPFLFYLIISIGLIISALVLKDTNILSYQNPLTYYILGILALRTIIIGLSLFNKYSYGYGLMTVIIPAAIIQIIIYFIR